MSLLHSIGNGPSAWAVANVKAQAFARVDSNADASLDKAELQTAFDAVAAKTGKTARDAEAVIARIDRNGDGAVTRLEIRAYAHGLRPAPASTVELARRDADSSGA